jgi:hypothetical protein
MRYNVLHYLFKKVLVDLQQLQLYVRAGTRILGDKYKLSPQPVSVHDTLIQTLDMSVFATFTRSPFTVTSICVKLWRPSYFELSVPNDPRWSSPPDNELEVAVSVMTNWLPNKDWVQAQPGPLLFHFIPSFLNL